MIIKGFSLVNELKALEAKKAAGENEDAILAEYDKRAGLITKDGEKVETGTFWDFENKTVKEVKKEKKGKKK